MTSHDDAEGIDDMDAMDDDALLAELAAAVAESGDVSERRRRAARAAFTWRTVDAELAELLHDSALDAGAAVRSGGDVPEPRSLSFGSGGVALELEVDGDVVTGQVVPTATATVALQRPERADGDELTVEVDAAGIFRLEGVSPGPARFVARAAGWTLTSPWVVL